MSITVLIPHKNCSNKLFRLLDSIPDNLNVVVVDDNSEAEVYSLLEEKIASCYFNVTLLKNSSNNSNAGTARNVAIDNCPASTRWVIFADADDVFVKSALQRLEARLRYLESSDLVFFNCSAKKEGSDEKSKRCDQYRHLIETWPDSKSSIPYRWPVPWGKAIKLHEVINAHGIRFSSRKAGNDLEFSAKLAIACKNVSIFAEDVYVCHESDVSLTATLDQSKALDRLKANISSNQIFYSHKIEFVHYNYLVRFFIKALPLILKKRELSVIVDAINNFYIAFRMNVLRRRVNPLSN